MKIEYRYMPGFVMDVLDTRPCEYGDHEAYLVIDYEGQLDWLCSRDAMVVSEEEEPR